MEASSKEIPVETLIERAGCLPLAAEGINVRILEYLPRVHTVTFTNYGRGAACLRRLGVLMDPPIEGVSRGMSPRSTLALYFDLRRATWWGLPFRGALPYQVCCAKLAHGICRQILSIIGIGSGGNVRLLRLLGEGPWQHDSNTRVLHDVMQVAFNVLLGVESCLPGHERKEQSLIHI